MAKVVHNFDVWYVQADTVYKNVPYSVVTDWADQGRLARTDKVRRAGVDEPWTLIKDHSQIGDFLYRRGEAVDVAAEQAEQLAPIEMDSHWPKSPADDDDDVDMIPLIDISLVLLIFFMMTAAVSTMSPTGVPEMKYAAALEDGSNTITVVVDKRPNDEVSLALRVGNSQSVDDSNLRTIQELMQHLDAKLAERSTPPIVHIACHRDLERGWVSDIATELNQRKLKEQIASYAAMVNESK